MAKKINLDKILTFNRILMLMGTPNSFTIRANNAQTKIKKRAYRSK